MIQPFGRTNKVFPTIWPKLLQPADLSEAEKMAELAVKWQAPVEVSSSQVMWGHYLRGADVPFIGLIGREVSKTSDAPAASRVLQASLLALLSALGRDCLEFCFLPVKTALEEHQITGALDAMEEAREEGLIKFFGLQVLGSPWAAQSVWQFHDAFEAVMIPQTPSGESESSLRPMADSRRVGVVMSSPLTLGGSDSLGNHPSVQTAANGANPHLSLLAASAKKGPTLLGIRTLHEMEEAQNWAAFVENSEAALAAARTTFGESSE